MEISGFFQGMSPGPFNFPMAPGQNLSKAFEQRIPLNAFVLCDGAEDAA